MMASSPPSLNEVNFHSDNLFKFLLSEPHICKRIEDIEDYYNMIYKRRNPDAVSFRDVWSRLKKSGKIFISANTKNFYVNKKYLEEHAEGESEQSVTSKGSGQRCSLNKASSHKVVFKQNEHSKTLATESVPKVLKCWQCRLIFETEEELYDHKTTDKHFVEFLKYWLKRNERDLVQDKLGISITTVEKKNDLNLVLHPNESGELTFRIYNKGTGGSCGRVQFRFCQLLHKLDYITLSDFHNLTHGSEPFLIPPATDYYVKLKAQSSDVGQWKVPLAFQFCLEEDYEPFHIVRCIVFHCTNETVASLMPKEDFNREASVTSLPPAETIIRGVHPSINKLLYRMREERTLLPVDIPPHLEEILANDLKPWPEMNPAQNKYLEKLMSTLEASLDHETYVQRFQSLLYIEFLQMQVDIRHYDMEDVPVEVQGQKLVIEVPGLEESRPSVLYGDNIYLSNKSEGKKRIEYEGIVHEIRSAKVFLGVNDELLEQFITGMTFHVRFSFNTLPFKLMQRALQLAEDTNLWPVLFPRIETSALSLPLIDEDKIVFFNRKIEKNHEQATAVRNIVTGVSRPTPYLLFGPPGTGKTVTLVETIKQVWKMFPECHILICTPSNSAANLITERLRSHIPERDILRLYSSTYSCNKIPESLKSCSNYKKEGYFYPSKKEIEKNYRILSCTLVTAGRLASVCFEENFFTHIFIDECGHSHEPGAILPIAGLLKSYEPEENEEKLGGQLILAGDHKQLGPVLRSHIALKYGLDISLLERLMMCEVYQRRHDGQFDSRVLTKLIRNYRSHPDILKLPSDLFYEGELKACNAEAKDHPLSLWNELPRKGFPVLFHGVTGEDLREENCPSYFNPHEISIVFSYVQKLLDVRKFKLKQEDIGIVAPYKRQVRKLQCLLQSKDLGDVSIGSVEEFQGQERKVIIISTVRSSPDLLTMDYHHKLGFLKNPKRFNVAITRAKYLLIIVGNPRILSKDENWNKLIEYCTDNGSFIGTGLRPGDEEDMLNLIERFRPFGLRKFRKNTRKDKMRRRIPISERTLQEDPPWKISN